jgi:hypothetical protein
MERQASSSVIGRYSPSEGVKEIPQAPIPQAKFG